MSKHWIFRYDIYIYIYVYMFEFIFSLCHQWCCKPTLCMRMPCPPHLAGSAVSCKPGRLCSTRSSHAAGSFSGSPPHDDSATATPLPEPSWCYTTSTWGCRVGISRIWRSRLLMFNFKSMVWPTILVDIDCYLENAWLFQNWMEW